MARLSKLLGIIAAKTGKREQPTGATALQDYLARKAAEAHTDDDAAAAGSEPEAAESL